MLWCKHRTEKTGGDDSCDGDVEVLPDTIDVGLGVGDGELHLCRDGRSTRNVGVMFIESVPNLEEAGSWDLSDDRPIINMVRVDAARGGNDLT